LRNPEELTIPLETGASVTALIYRAEEQTISASLILAHGAGAGQRSPFMVDFAQSLAGRGLPTVTFNFLYTEQRRRVPDRRPSLDACYRAVVREVRRQVLPADDVLFIGGKSMGGRIATHIAAADPQLPIGGLILLGYPLHPPGRPDELRDAHLPDIHQPMLIVQGSRDAFGTPAELEAVLTRMSPTPTLHVVEGGDHSFKIPRLAKTAQHAEFEAIQRTIVAWISRLAAARRETVP